MDDYSVSSLVESRNEWCVRLLNILTPNVIAGLNGVWKEAYSTAGKHNEKSKYLMTFQNYLAQIPKWSSAIIDREVERIVEESGCSYLEDLLSCVHVIQLKALSCVRVGQKQKKVEIEIPALATFIHNMYIACARKIYTNVYLFETGVPALQIQKNNRELELIIKECIMDTIRESVPTERILRAYMDETMEDEIETKQETVVEDIPGEGEGDGNGDSQGKSDAEVKADEDSSSQAGGDTVAAGANAEAKDNGETTVDKTSADRMDSNDLAATLTINTADEVDVPKTSALSEPEITNIQDATITKVGGAGDAGDSASDVEKPVSLSFNDTDVAISTDGHKESVSAPKSIERLEEISAINNEKRKADDSDDEDEGNLSIGDSVTLDLDELVSLEAPKF